MSQSATYIIFIMTHFIILLSIPPVKAACSTDVHCSPFRNTSNLIAIATGNLMKMPVLPNNTKAIYFENLSIPKLDNNDFENLTGLYSINFTNGKIADIEGKTFGGLNMLEILILRNNKLTDVRKSWFQNLTSLRILDLYGNDIRKIQADSFKNLRNLTQLNMRNNKIRSMAENLFHPLISLQVLILGENKMIYLRASWFDKLRFLRELDLYDNDIKIIETGSFKNLVHLNVLDLQRNKIRSLPENLFGSLQLLHSLKVDDFTHCCAAQAAKANVLCDIRHSDGLSNCGRLLKYNVLKYFIWILSILALVGNLAVILWRVFTKDQNQVSSFLLTNLAAADLLMGVYLFIIAFKDTSWNGMYYKHHFTWRESKLCFTAGVIATLSNEASVFTLFVITLDRLICIVFPFRFERLTLRKAMFIMAVVWSVSSIIAVAPLLNDSYFFDEDGKVNLFGQTALCLPFMLSSERPAGWEYSVFAFVALNGFAFFCIVIAYAKMYRTATKAANAVRSTRMKQDSTIAKRMMFIILADFLCWFPVIILSIMALTERLYDPSQEVYAWTAVFVLPINSSINPYLYTFSTRFVKEKVLGAGNVQNRGQANAALQSGNVGGKQKFTGSYKVHGTTMPLQRPATVAANEAFKSDEGGVL